MRARENKQSSVFIIAAALVLLSPARAMADGAGYLVDHGIAIYYAVIPAEMIRGHDKRHPEATMHGGAPRSQHAYHLMVALFDVSTLRRITDAEVTAKVVEIGFAGEEKQLENFAVAVAITYGNYFVMAPNTNYRIHVNVKTTSSAEAGHIEFPFKHE